MRRTTYSNKPKVEMKFDNTQVKMRDQQHLNMWNDTIKQFQLTQPIDSISVWKRSPKDQDIAPDCVGLICKSYDNQLKKYQPIYKHKCTDPTSDLFTMIVNEFPKKEPTTTEP